MEEFQYHDDSLRCESVALEAIADALGTPTYVYSQKMLYDSVRRFDDAFAEVPHLVCYGIKANCISPSQAVRQPLRIKARSAKRAAHGA